MARCPFRINAVPPYNAKTDGGCHADGETEDRAHLKAAMVAAVAAGKRLYLPAGTYLVSTDLAFDYGDGVDGLYMYGDGATTIINMPTTVSNTNIITALRVNGVTLRDFTMTTPQQAIAARKVSALECENCQNWTLTNLTLDNMRFGFRSPSQTTASTGGFTFTNINITDTVAPMMLADMVDSIWTGGSWECNSDASGDHACYYERDNHRNTFTGVTMLAGKEYALQLSNSAHVYDSDSTTFTSCVFNSRTGQYARAFCCDEHFSGITLANCTFYGSSHADAAYEAIVWWGGTNIVWTGVTGLQGTSETMHYATGATCTTCSMAGTWNGSTLGVITGVNTAGMSLV